jgi:hypothetical protein
MKEDELAISKDPVRKIVNEDLKKRKVCSCFVPHSLTAEQKQDQAAECHDLVEMADSDSDF